MRDRTVRTLLAGLLVGALTGALAGAVVGQAAGAPGDSSPRGREVISRAVVLTVTNHNETSALCPADGEEHRLVGRLVGPRDEVLGHAGSTRVNVLVHDAGTGGWFWRMPQRRLDYAGRLAARGETSLVLDRLGFGGSDLDDGRATCLGAQATILHQVVQDLRAGIYEFAADTRRTVPHAGQVVVHGHGVGAAVAQLEAAEFDDVDGLVLMSWTDAGASRAALAEAARQTSTCLGTDYAAYGETARDFRSLLFRSAAPAVQRAAAGLRNPTPCGDVTSLLSTVGALNLQGRAVEAPVLLLHGARDARLRDGAAAAQADRYPSSAGVTSRIFRGTGSALPLEAAAPRVRRTVLGWLGATLVER